VLFLHWAAVPGFSELTGLPFCNVQPLQLHVAGALSDPGPEGLTLIKQLLFERVEPITKSWVTVTPFQMHRRATQKPEYR
jgi:hypothetical protein